MIRERRFLICLSIYAGLWFVLWGVGALYLKSRMDRMGEQPALDDAEYSRRIALYQDPDHPERLKALISSEDQAYRAIRKIEFSGFELTESQLAAWGLIGFLVGAFFIDDWRKKLP